LHGDNNKAHVCRPILVAYHWETWPVLLPYTYLFDIKAGGIVQQCNKCYVQHFQQLQGTIQRVKGHKSDPWMNRESVQIRNCLSDPDVIDSKQTDRLGMIGRLPFEYPPNRSAGVRHKDEMMMGL